MNASTEAEFFKQFAEEVKAMAQPIDFDELEAKGVLTKEGAWYRLHKPKELPKHAAAKVAEIRQDSRGTKVKFRKPATLKVLPLSSPR